MVLEMKKSENFNIYRIHFSRESLKKSFPDVKEIIAGLVVELLIFELVDLS